MRPKRVRWIGKAAMGKSITRQQKAILIMDNRNGNPLDQTDQPGATEGQETDHRETENTLSKNPPKIILMNKRVFHSALCCII